MESSIPPLLDLSSIGSPTLHPKETWKYLGFIFDKKLMIHQHVDHYLNKAISLVKCMKLLGNSSREINPVQKYQLYRCCVLPIALYGFQFWFYNKVSLSYHMKILGKMQRRTAIWILEAFKTLPTEDIEAITRIIPIKFHLQKLTRRSQLRPLLLPSNHIIRSFIDDPSNLSKKPIPHSVNSFTNQQRNIAKGYLINLNNKFYSIFPSFSPLHPEFAPGSQITDNFLNRFSFNLASKKEKDQIHFQELDEIVLHFSSSLSMALVVTNTSIKNDIATFISHVHLAN